MKAGQRLVANDGYEVLLFPLEYMYMSQDEGGDYSHLYTYSIDFLGWGANGRIYKCPYYAPCTCKCVATSGSGRVFQSINPVHWADGTLSMVTFACHHDNTPVSPSDHIYRQGDLIGHTGTAGNVTGDHLHLNTARGTYQGYYDVGTGHYQLKNATHIYNTMYVNDTVIIRGFNHPWKTYTSPTPPIPTGIKHKFKWVLYTNKIKERNNV